MGVWKIWTYAAARNSPATMYGVGGSPPEWRSHNFHGAAATVDYPPFVLDELAVVGRAYRFLNKPAFPDDTALTVAIKTPLVLFEVGFLWLAFAAVRRAVGTSAARWAATAYWLNPGTLLDGPVLGYLDPLFMFPLAAALVAGSSGWSLLAGALLAFAVLTKAQALVALPAVALAVWKGGPQQNAVRRLGLAALGGLAASALVVGPVIAAGGGPNMVAALRSLARHDMLSANAPNLWWIVGYLLRAWYSVHDLGVWVAYTAPTKILAISRTIELGYPNPRLVGTALTILAMGWATVTARNVRGPLLACGVGAFMVHAYATLSAQVHENHLYAAIPLLVVAAAGHRRLRPVLWAVSAIFALNLNAFYGVSEYIDGYAVPRTLTVIDLTVWLALANCATLVWHGWVLSGECSAGNPQVVPNGARMVDAPS